MSAPSRRPEISRRRTRREKIDLMRKRYAKASPGEREKILEKLRAVSPTMSVEEFTSRVPAKPR